jgi:hypothetical protein
MPFADRPSADAESPRETRAAEADRIASNASAITRAAGIVPPKPRVDIPKIREWRSRRPDQSPASCSRCLAIHRIQLGHDRLMRYAVPRDRARIDTDLNESQKSASLSRQPASDRLARHESSNGYVRASAARLLEYRRASSASSLLRSCSCLQCIQSHRGLQGYRPHSGKRRTTAIAPTMAALKAGRSSAGIQYSRWAPPPASCTA